MKNTYSKRELQRTRLLNRDIKLKEELARGGEGTIYSIVGTKLYVAKIFHEPDHDKTQKLNAMLADMPNDLTRRPPLRHISIAWPTERIVNARGTCIGFTMPYIDHKETFPLLRLYNPRDRKSLQINFTWEYLLRMALNLASIIKELHRKGYVIGDLNESNILVTKQALVTLVDCDSIQVPKDKNTWRHLLGQPIDYFRCFVAKPEYVPPELQGCDFSQVNRTPNHDNFGLAVLIFLMLMEGWHPFASIWKGEGMAPLLEENIQAGIFPYIPSNEEFRPMYAPPLEILPPHIQRLMLNCFVDRHRPSVHFRWFFHRPRAATWFKALAKASNHLSICDKNSSHVYSDHLERCPWCQRIKRGIPEPFPPTSTKTPHPPPPSPAWKKLVVQVAFILLVILLYTLEISTWRIWGSWFISSDFQTKFLTLLIMLGLPPFISLIFRSLYFPAKTVLE